MSLVKTGQGVTDIRGGFGGVYFTRDKAGLHSSAKPRRVHQRTAAQKKQRDAFIKARSFCRNESFADKPKDWLNRCVSYNIYRALNGLDIGFFMEITGDLTPDVTGFYSVDGEHLGKPQYVREDIKYRIIWDGFMSWDITMNFPPFFALWLREDPCVFGDYVPIGIQGEGIPTFAQWNTDPPPDYQIPGM